MTHITLPTSKVVGYSFGHPSTIDTIGTINGNKLKVERRLTVCRLFSLDKAEDGHIKAINSLALGKAKCCPTDNFCKATGRLIALARAMDVAAFDPQERLTLLHHYLKQGYRPLHRSLLAQAIQVAAFDRAERLAVWQTLRLRSDKPEPTPAQKELATP